MSEPRLIPLRINGWHLAAVIAQAILGRAIPPGTTPEEFLAGIPEETRERLFRAAAAATDYVVTEINQTTYKDENQ